MDQSVWLWVGFNLFVLAMLALDLGVFHRQAHTVSGREAVIWSVVWISLSLVFNAVIYFFWDRMIPASGYTNTEAALAFFTGYLIEKSLSVDNIFVFALIFSFFAVPAAYQHRLLFWGVLGALFFRGIFIAAGAALLENFHWTIYVFGAFLVLTGIKMAVYRGHAAGAGKNPVLRLVRRLVPMTDEYDGQRFFTRRGTRFVATPLLAVLVAIETTDVIFAVDSIPAIFAVTSEPFLVFTSNAFAILGLRSLFFLVAGLVSKFTYLKVGLAAVLVFVGTKMTLVDVVKIPALVSLAVVLALLGGSIAASWWVARKRSTALPSAG